MNPRRPSGAQVQWVRVHLKAKPNAGSLFEQAKCVAGEMLDHFSGAKRGGVTSANVVASTTWSIKIVSGTSLVFRIRPI